jgi:hypothetical protein
MIIGRVLLLGVPGVYLSGLVSVPHRRPGSFGPAHNLDLISSGRPTELGAVALVAIIGSGVHRALPVRW